MRETQRPTTNEIKRRPAKLLIAMSLASSGVRFQPNLQMPINRFIFIAEI
jgi:hypothetical protein